VSVPSTAFGSVLESNSEVYMAAYSEGTWECLQSVHENVISSKLGVCHQMQLGVYLGVYLGVCLGVSCEHTQKYTVKQGGSVIARAIQSMLGSVTGNVLTRVLRAYLEP